MANIVWYDVPTECALADYVSGIQSEKVPFVFLPIQGQLINPNAEIALSGNSIRLTVYLGVPSSAHTWIFRNVR